MNKKIQIGIIISVIFMVSLAGADTFKHISTGETFHGFRTSTQSGDKVRVFNANANKFTPLDLTEYEVTTNQEGRRDSVMVIKINQPEILLSEAISQVVSDAVIKAADSGPKAILIEIDSPGGNGMYMRNVTEAIRNAIDKTGCQIVAYLSGGRYGGAFSAAAITALACEQIYIAPTASMGAIGPIVSTGMTNDEYAQYLETYSPDILATFSIYAASLAQQKNRPELLARALVDKHLAIAEVKDANGRQSLIEVGQRKENQSIVRMITEGLSSNVPEDTSSTSTFREYGKLLNLSATEAIQWKMADKLASTSQEVLEDLNLQSTRIVNVSGITKTIQKFSTARRNMEQLIKKIQYEENRVAILQDQLAEMERILRTSTSGYEITQGQRVQRTTRGRVVYRSVPLRDTYSNERDFANTDAPMMTRQGEYIPGQGQELWRRGQRVNPPNQQTVYAEVPSGNIQQVQMELMAVLSEMIGDYQRAIGLAQRWPGALPAGISIQILQDNMFSAQTLYSGIQRMSIQGY